MGAFGDDSGPPHTRADYETNDEWLGHCRRGGELPNGDDKVPWGQSGAGDNVALFNGIYGHTRRAFSRTFEEFGVSRVLTFAQVYRNFCAIALANCLGSVINTKVDISWATVGITSDIRVGTVQRKFLAWVRRWLKARGVRAFYIWTQEVGMEFGLHTHLLLHVPSKFAEREAMLAAGITGPTFAQEAEAELQRIVARELVKAAKGKTVLIRHRTSTADIKFQWIWFEYRMKGLGRRARAEALRCGFGRASDQGTVAMKRTGVSRLIDDANVRRFSAMNDFPSFAPDDTGAWPKDRRFYAWSETNARAISWPNITWNGNLRPSDFQLDDIDPANFG